MHTQPPARCFALISLLGAFAVGACTDAPSALDAPAFSHGGAHAISGAVLGPDGTSICNFVPEEARLNVRVVNLVAAPLIVATQRVTCPVNTFSFSVNPGTYRLQVLMPGTSAIGALPFRHLESAAVELDGGDVSQDVRVFDGIPMGGSATLDGAPLAGVPLTLVYDGGMQLGAAFGASRADGTWDDASPAERSPMRVQDAVRYAVSGQCAGLGARVTEGPPSAGFLFPTEVAAINCTMVTAPAVEFTHDRTRMVVTAMPAEIGGGEPELIEQYGQGWGVQFPVDPLAVPAHAPLSASHLWIGGLLIGLEPSVILSGMDLGSYLLECGSACRDLGLDAGVKIVTSGPDGTIIRWAYSDAPSTEGVGFKIVQHSFDGRPPADYVLFKYSITNQGRSTRTFHAGFFGDWDVTENAAGDVGFTELGGRLMYMTTTNGGAHVGSLLLGDAPASGAYFFNNAHTPFSLVDQVRALNGQLRRTTIGPADNRVIHGVGPITLKRGKTAVVWIAIVAGESRGELLANAAAAAAHVGQMVAQSPFQGTVSSTTLGFGETLIVQPAASVPWDGDEIVTFGGTTSSFVLASSPSEIAVVVPRLPTGLTDVLIVNQGIEQSVETQTVPVAIASTFTPVDWDHISTAPDVTAGPFPMSFYIELSNEDPDHFVTVAPSADLPLTVRIEWQTGADIDLLWTNQDGTAYVGNFDGASLANPEQTSVTVPAGETWRIRFNKYDTSPPALARVTITSP